MGAGTLARGALLLAYPLLVYFGLARLSPRWVALALLALAATSRAARRGLGQVARGEWLILGATAGLCAAVPVSGSERLLRLYPALVNAGMLALFGRSLLRPPTVVERLARLQDPQLPPEGVAYTRRVTQVWCLFFVGNGALAAWTAFRASRATWLLYNGLVAYLLMGLLFAGEWLVRRRVLGGRPS